MSVLNLIAAVKNVLNTKLANDQTLYTEQV